MSADFMIKKLQAYCDLKSADIDALGDLALEKFKLKAGQDIIREGEDPKNVFLITSGMACRYKLLEDGRRQILAFFLPGDLCDLNVYILEEMDHSIAAVTAIEYAVIAPDAMNQIGDDHPRVLRALWWESLVTASIQREWTVSLGQRDALESLAHLFCELFLRMRMIGMVDGKKCQIPLTQQYLADALGLTPTHVGRVLRQLELTGIARFERRVLEVHDLAELKTIACFNPRYLHHR
jgi:CRP-like cAMP-binding protein